jgi:putative spermidine/putrescine transport system permease protein
MSSVRSSRGGAVSGWLLLLLAAAYFLLPLLALARFSFQRVPVALLGWHNLFDNWTLDGLLDALHDPGFGPALWLSVRLAIGAIILTLGLLLPTALWVHLRAPKARSLVEVLSVLPYVVPPIALVVGVTGAFRDLAPWFIRSDLSLIPFYTLLAMPFTYRALDAGINAIDLRTLVDASRSLGAGWTTTTLRVLVPNLASALISSAFLTATVVLGEFTIASLLLKETLPMFNLQISQREVQGGFALGLLLLLVSTLFLALITLLTRRRGSTAETATVLAGPAPV